MVSKCLFCELSKENKYWIFDNKYFYAIFDIHPVSPGHSLVIPKRHVISLLDLSKEEWIALKPAIEKVVKISESTNLKKIYENLVEEKRSERSPWFCKKMLLHTNLNKKPDGYNFGNNDGETAGRTINHLHIQIIPRYRGDVKDPIGGIRTIIPKLGNYK